MNVGQNLIREVVEISSGGIQAVSRLGVDAGAAIFSRTFQGHSHGVGRFRKRLEEAGWSEV